MIVIFGVVVLAFTVLTWSGVLVHRSQKSANNVTIRMRAIVYAVFAFGLVAGIFNKLVGGALLVCSALLGFGLAFLHARKI